MLSHGRKTKKIIPKHQSCVSGKNLQHSQHSHQQVINLLEHITDAFFTLDNQGCFQYLNRQAEIIFQKTLEDLLGKAISEIVPEATDRDFYAVCSQKCQEAIAQNMPLTFEQYCPRTNTWLEIRAFPSSDGLGVYLRDVSDRRKSLDILQEQEQFLRSIYDGVETAILIIDVQWRGKELDFSFVGMNSAYERLINLETSQVQPGSVPIRIFPADVAQKTLRQYEKCVRTGKTINYEQSYSQSSSQSSLQCSKQDETRSWWETSLTPLRDSHGVIYRIVSSSTDITDRKQTEQALRESEAEFREQASQLEIAIRQLQTTQAQLVQNEKMSSLGQLVAGIAHEINNPVNFIYGNLTHTSQYVSDLLWLVNLYGKYYPEPMPEIKSAIEEVDMEFLGVDLPRLMESMKSGAERIRQIVLSLRNFSRLDEDGLKSVNIHEGIENTLLILQHRLYPQKAGENRVERPAIEVITNYSKLPSAECYPGQLNQVFMNLLSNAIDSLEEQGEINIHHEPKIWITTSLLRHNSRIAIKIRDNGLGMIPEVQSRLFDPFFTTKPVGKGTGLGLAISYKIVVDKHRGELTCNSAPGEGAEFTIEIPIFRRHS